MKGKEKIIIIIEHLVLCVYACVCVGSGKRKRDQIEGEVMGSFGVLDDEFPSQGPS